MVRFRCKYCGKKIGVPDKDVGKRGKCPKCKNVLVVPKTENIDKATRPSNVGDSTATSKFSGLDSSVFETPPKEKGSRPASEQDIAPSETGKDAEKPQEKKEAGKTELVGKRSLPCFIDVFLYPISLSGLKNFAVFVGVPFLIDISSKFIPYGLSILFMVSGIIAKIVIVIYLYWYFTECIRDSALGGLRAPGTSARSLSLGYMLSQTFNIIACFLLFWTPFFIYVLLAKRIDVIFWLLLLYAVFFFPMFLLSVTMFDSVSGFNPLLVLNSISRTFKPYLGLVLLFVIAISLVGIFGPKEVQSQAWRLILQSIRIYLTLVAAHLLGRFYFRYEEKLNWEV